MCGGGGNINHKTCNTNYLTPPNHNMMAAPISINFTFTTEFNSVCSREGRGHGISNNFPNVILDPN